MLAHMVQSLEANGRKLFVSYLATGAAAAAAFFFIYRHGSRLAVMPLARVPGPPSVDDTLAHLLLALIVINVASQCLALLFRRFHQPAVMGEIIAGILLGPSLLGRLAPQAMTFVFAPAVLPLLSAVAHIGVIFFMFLVGLHFDPKLLRKRTQATVTISHASILLPFTLGGALALGLFPAMSGGGVSFSLFALFMGVSMSVTAFPVLARILADRGLQSTPLGGLAIACAAIDDVTAWCLLALVASIAKMQVAYSLLTAAGTLLYVLFMIAIVKPLLQRWFQGRDLTARSRQRSIAFVLVGLLGSAFATQSIGIHALFGAFLLGAIVPHDSGLARELSGNLGDIAHLLLPSFFAVTGLRMNVGLIEGSQWLVCLAIVVFATAGKFGGSTLAARVAGLGWRDSACLGVLMNTRGLMELIVLNIGLELGIITAPLYSMLMIMAVVSSLATTPLIHWLTQETRVGVYTAP